MLNVIWEITWHGDWLDGGATNEVGKAGGGPGSRGKAFARIDLETWRDIRYTQKANGDTIWRSGRDKHRSQVSMSSMGLTTPPPPTSPHVHLRASPHLQAALPVRNMPAIYTIYSFLVDTWKTVTGEIHFRNVLFNPVYLKYHFKMNQYKDY